MAETRICADCGASVPDDAPSGFCPACLLSAGVDGKSAISEGVDAQAARAWADSPGAARLFGDYELLEEIARGGMGIVYKARQISLDRIVAVKLILSGAAASKESIHRFRVEATAAANLQHPNIVAVHEVGAHQGENFLVMDFVDGPNFSHFVGRQPLPAQRAARYLKLIAEAIHYAHERGILHRDLKPSNVLLNSATDQPRVTDFGLAKRLEGESDLTLSGQMLGSPNYMSPEQAAGRRGAVGKRSDTYSLGAILYHLLTGRAPFQGESITDVLHQVVNNEPLTPGLLTPGVPHDLETICLKCLEKEPEKRYPTAQALAEELGRFLRDEPIHARPVSRTEHAWRWCRRKPALASFAAATVLLLLAVAIGAPIAAFRINQARHAEKNERLQAERNLYATDMILAQQALEINNLGRARELLGRHQPAEKSGTRNPLGSSDIRGWEWQYLWNLSQSDELPSTRLGPCPLCSNSLVPSHDGKLLATKLADEETFQVWDLVTKRLLGAYTNAPGIPVSANNHSLAFFRDDTVLAVGLMGGVVRRFHPRTLKEVAPPLQVKGEIEDVYYSPDGQALLVAAIPWNRSIPSMRFTMGRTELTWFDTADDHIVKTMTFPVGASWAMAGDQRTAAVGLDDDTMEVYELGHGTLLTSFKFSGQRPEMTALSADGAFLAIADLNRHGELWDVTAGRRLDWVATAPVRNFAFSPDGKRLVTTSKTQVVKVWEVPSGRELMTLKGHEGGVHCASFLPGGQTFVTGGEDETIRFWNRETRRAPPTTQPLSREGKPPRIWLAPTGDAVLIVPPNSGATNLAFSLWNVPQWVGTEEQTISWPADFKFEAILPPGGRYLPLVDASGNVLVWGVAVSPGGRLLALADAAGSVLLWDVQDRRARTTIHNDAARVCRLQFSTDGRMLAVTTDNGWTRLWQIAPTNLVLQFAHRASWRSENVEIGAMGFSPDGALYAQGEGPGHIEIWNLARKEPVSFWRADGKFVTSLAFSADGKTLATTGVDRVIRLWDPYTGKRKPGEFRTSSSLSGMVSLAFSPDGSRLLGAVGNGSVKLWDTASAQELLTLEGHQSAGQIWGLEGAAFSKDGQTIVAASPLDVTRWSTRTEERN